MTLSGWRNGLGVRLCCNIARRTEPGPMGFVEPLEGTFGHKLNRKRTDVPRRPLRPALTKVVACPRLFPRSDPRSRQMMIDLFK